VSSAVEPVDPGGDARTEVKAYLRIETDADDAVIGRAIAAAVAHGEAFTGQQWLTREARDTLVPNGCWQALGRRPVQVIEDVERILPDDAEALPVSGYAIDIDADGCGWVRVTDAATNRSRIRVTYQAGMAGDWSGLPDGLRQGAVRLASHLYSHRDAADEGAPPAAIAALWRPWRRMRLA
jgi:uncharacterized phiE125 gp8 family phage protein